MTTFEEQRALLRADIARIYGVPQELIGDTGNSPYASAALEAAAFRAEFIAWAKQVVSALATITPSDTSHASAERHR